MLILMVRKSRTEEAEKQHTLSPNQASGKKMSSPCLRKGPPPGGGLPQPLWESWVQGPRGPWTCILAVGANQAGAAQLARGRARGHGSCAPGQQHVRATVQAGLGALHSGAPMPGSNTLWERRQASQQTRGCRHGRGTPLGHFQEPWHHGANWYEEVPGGF